MPTWTIPASAWRSTGVLEAQGFVSASSASLTGARPRRFRSWAGRRRFRDHRRQHGFHGQPLHRRPQNPLGRRLHAGGAGGKRPDRAVIVHAQRARGVQRHAARHRRHRGEPAPHRALRLLVRKGAPLDPARRQGRPATEGNAERQLVELAYRLVAGEPIGTRLGSGIRGALAFVRRGAESRSAGRPIDAAPDPYAIGRPRQQAGDAAVRSPGAAAAAERGRARVSPPAFVRRQVKPDPVLYARTPRASCHLETDPGNARARSRTTAGAMSGSIRRRFR